MPGLLAVCEGTSVADQIFGVLIAIGVGAFWVGLIYMSLWFELETGQRRLLGALWLACAVVGSIVILSLHGEIVESLLLVLLLTLAIGVGGVLISQRASVMRGIGVAITGGLILPAFVVVVLILHVSLGSGCLGDELG